jgi:8-oxo-dGTP pyrophosphatase MutT (NUDIX family)
MTKVKEERHKTITVLVSFIDDKPRFLTMRDRRHREWIFITGGCRKRETGNPLRCALRELEEETRGVINLKKGSYNEFFFTYDNRSPEEIAEDNLNDLDVTICHHVYIIEYNIPRSTQLHLVHLFNEQKQKMDQRKREKLPIRRTYDENDYMSFDTLDEFNKRKQWDFIKKCVIDNPVFYTSLGSMNKLEF